MAGKYLLYVSSASASFSDILLGHLQGFEHDISPCPPTSHLGRLPSLPSLPPWRPYMLQIVSGMGCSSTAWGWSPSAICSPSHPSRLRFLCQSTSLSMALPIQDTSGECSKYGCPDLTQDATKPEPEQLEHV
ncbi:hypothetical protein MVEN_00885500 [Mycena venus]|uniref:Uncharacterized protein n=1 Tax=Mycena venus TaxID=2733690 RepID=A0A8H6YI20_9AGAR|nr:hypothetical protein MVEN_00885500 [Mycena venus]